MWRKHKLTWTCTAHSNIAFELHQITKNHLLYVSCSCMYLENTLAWSHCCMMQISASMHKIYRSTYNCQGLRLLTHTVAMRNSGYIARDPKLRIKEEAVMTEHMRTSRWSLSAHSVSNRYLDAWAICKSTNLCFQSMLMSAKSMKLSSSLSSTYSSYMTKSFFHHRFEFGRFWCPIFRGEMKVMSVGLHHLERWGSPA